MIAHWLPQQDWWRIPPQDIVNWQPQPQPYNPNASYGMLTQNPNISTAVYPRTPFAAPSSLQTPYGGTIAENYIDKPYEPNPMTGYKGESPLEFFVRRWAPVKKYVKKGKFNRGAGGDIAYAEVIQDNPQWRQDLKGRLKYIQAQVQAGHRPSNYNLSLLRTAQALGNKLNVNPDTTPINPAQVISSLGTPPSIYHTQGTPSSNWSSFVQQYPALMGWQPYHWWNVGKTGGWGSFLAEAFGPGSLAGAVLTPLLTSKLLGSIGSSAYSKAVQTGKSASEATQIARQAMQNAYKWVKIGKKIGWAGIRNIDRRRER